MPVRQSVPGGGMWIPGETEMLKDAFGLWHLLSSIKVLWVVIPHGQGDMLKGLLMVWPLTSAQGIAAALLQIFLLLRAVMAARYIYIYVLFFSPSTRVGNTVWDRFLSLSDHFKLRDTPWLFASCVSYLASPWQGARGGGGGGGRSLFWTIRSALCCLTMTALISVLYGSSLAGSAVNHGLV